MGLTLITGAAGRIGSYLRPRLTGRLRLLDVVSIVDADDVVIGSLTDADTMAEACRGVDAIVHLGGIPNEAPWAEILAANIDGTHTVLEAARAAGVRRVILASSNHAAGFQPRGDEPLPADIAPRPDTYYGVSKAAIEALGRLYADRFGMDIACLRIGTCADRPTDQRGLATWLSPDDVARLVQACLDAEPFGYRVIWGVSANTRRWWSLTEAEDLGYRSRSDAEVFADEVPPTPGEYDDLVGGPFVAKPLGQR